MIGGIVSIDNEYLPSSDTFTVQRLSAFLVFKKRGFPCLFIFEIKPFFKVTLSLLVIRKLI